MNSLKTLAQCVFSFSAKLVVSLLITLSFLPVVSAQINSGRDKGDSANTGPLCGVNCLYAAGRVLGKSVDYESLLDVKYVGSRRGSSIQELVAGLKDIGLHASPMVGLDASALRSSRHPVILHVSRSRHGRTFDHWVLYLGIEQDKARILDPPNEMELLTFAELLSMWDGVGVIVADEPISLLPYQLASMNIVLSLFCMAIFFRLMGARLESKRPEPLARHLVNSMLQGVIVLAISIGVAVIWHFMGSEGLLSNRQAVANVNTAHFARTLPEVTFDEMKEMLSSGSALIVDARPRTVYLRGHIPTSINIPIDASGAAVREIMKETPQSERIVIYCQSKQCPWDEEIGSELVWNGYRNVVTYSGGWEEWMSKVEGRK